MTNNKNRISKMILTTVLFAVAAAGASSAQPQRSGMPPPPPPKPTPVNASAVAAVPPASNAPQRITHEGINVEFRVEP
ncbi:MAG TPA: hypothetical protein VER76_16035, partial [Pyrinomonadaceae bacterium]|nr:hypothetical protein [Pyrinomonadaceae bacterium]